MSKKKISYSGWDKFLTCPKMFDMHYNARLRPKGISSPLVFGVAMDEGLNVMLLSGSLKDAIDTFRNKFEWKDMGEVSWDPRDMEPTLADRAGFENDAHYSWGCMRVKGRMLLEAYYNEIYPLIEEVESVQKNLHDRPGVIDAIVNLRGYGRVLLDNKTSARPYQPDAIGASTQLALYARDQKITRVGFAVLVKQIQKNTVRTCLKCTFDGSHVRHKTCPNLINGLRCHGEWTEHHSPKAVVQLMVEDIPKTLGELTHASMGEVEKAIEQKIYPRNLKACGKVYGKPCPYMNYCWNNDDSNLEYKPEQKEKK